MSKRQGKKTTAGVRNPDGRRNGKKWKQSDKIRKHEDQEMRGRLNKTLPPSDNTPWEAAMAKRFYSPLRVYKRTRYYKTVTNAKEA